MPYSSSDTSFREQFSRVGGRVAFIAADVIIIWIATLLAYWTRFSGSVRPDFMSNVGVVAIAASVVFPLIFWALRLYHHVWRYVSIEMILKLAGGVLAGLAVLTGADLLLSGADAPRIAPLGILLIMSTFVFVGSATTRAFGRLLVYLQSQSGQTPSRSVIIVGAGDAGSLLLRDIENQPGLRIRVLGFLDDDAKKARRIVRGVPVLGPIDSLPELVTHRHVDEIMIAIPTATPAEHRRILDVCASTGVTIRIMQPFAVGDAVHGLSDLRRVDIEDLLGREPVEIDLKGIGDTLQGKVVAVTGAAGSIGSELCRQIIRFSPARLVLMDMDESRLYEMYLELRMIDTVAPVMRICDVRDQGKVDRIFEEAHPQIVLHAAAYKHVPLMELAPDEAVKANVLGTRNVIRSCEHYGVKHFILISTDKAVKPSSMMGLTKALAERLALDAARRGKLRASAVRFGNVLGSRGSVVPIFEEQLRNGGPLLVTHPAITRYFMTIPEAARLVLQAQAISNGGDLFVLEMGEPVKIVDLARKMIALSGSDARIEFIGLRPAEKLHEILVHHDEELIETGRDKILRVNALPLLPADFDSIIDHLIDAAICNDRVSMIKAIAEIMPDYQPYEGDKE